MLHLTNYDFIFGAIILASAILAAIRGCITELLSLSTWFIALFVMQRYSSHIQKIIPQVVNNGLLRSLIAYIIAFLAVAIIIAIIKKIFHKFICSFGLGGLNNLLGFLFGIVRGLIICALIIIIMEMFNLDDSHGWEKSWFSPILKPTVKLIIDAIPNRVKNINHEIGSKAEIFIHNESGR